MELKCANIKDKTWNGTKLAAETDRHNKGRKVFENPRKKSHSTLRAKRATFTFWVDKSGPFWRVFDKPEACGQTVLPDRSILIGQKSVENAKIQIIQLRHFE